MHNNRIKGFLQPPPDDDAEAKLLGALQREGKRRIAAEAEIKRLRRLMDQCPACREGART